MLLSGRVQPYRPFRSAAIAGSRVPAVSVPRTHPPSSGNHPVLVDEAAQVIGSSWPGEVDVTDVRRSRVESGRRTLAEGTVGAVGVVVLDVLGEHGLQVSAGRG